MNKPHLFIVFVAVALATLPACKKDAASKDERASETEAFGRLTVDEVEAKLALAKEGKLAFYAIDNNAKSVFDKGHVPGAKWVDHEHVTAADLPADKDATLVFYCANEH